MRVESHDPVEREAAREVHLAVAMPANERMDWLVEKATELGVASIQPLMAERSVLRLSGDRARKKQAHWQAIAVAACEQCGRNRVPPVHEVADLRSWLSRGAAGTPSACCSRCARRRWGCATRAAGSDAAVFLTGPEGGWSDAEEEAALAAGFRPVTLGARVLRAETAALAALAALA